MCQGSIYRAGHSESYESIDDTFQMAKLCLASSRNFQYPSGVFVGIGMTYLVPRVPFCDRLGTNDLPLQSVYAL